MLLKYRHELLGLLLAIGILSPGSYAFSQDADLIKAAQEACAGLSSTKANSERGKIKFDKYELHIDGGSTLVVEERGVLIRKIENFTYEQYSTCMTNLLDMVRRIKGGSGSNKSPEVKSALAFWFEDGQIFFMIDAQAKNQSAAAKAIMQLTIWLVAHDSRFFFADDSKPRISGPAFNNLARRLCVAVQVTTETIGCSAVNDVQISDNAPNARKMFAGSNSAVLDAVAPRIQINLACDPLPLSESASFRGDVTLYQRPEHSNEACETYFNERSVFSWPQKLRDLLVGSAMFNAEMRVAVAGQIHKNSIGTPRVSGKYPTIVWPNTLLWEKGPDGVRSIVE